MGNVTEYCGDHLTGRNTITFTTASPVLPPTAVDDGYAVNQGAVLTVNAPGVLANDTIPIGVTPSVEFLPPFPTGAGLTNSGSGGFILDMRPSPTFVGTLTLHYVIHTVNGDSNTATVTVTVKPLLPPTAVDDRYTVTQGAVLTVNAPGVLANDTIPAGVTPSVEFLPPFPPAGLTNSGGSGGFILDMRPNPTFVGTLTLHYVIHSVNGDSNTATVTITVNSVTLSWTQKLPALSPPPRSLHAMAYHAATSEVVLFGGAGLLGRLGDTWAWNG